MPTRTACSGHICSNDRSRLFGRRLGLGLDQLGLEPLPLGLLRSRRDEGIQFPLTGHYLCLPGFDQGRIAARDLRRERNGGPGVGEGGLSGRFVQQVAARVLDLDRYVSEPLGDPLAAGLVEAMTIFRTVRGERKLAPRRG